MAGEWSGTGVLNPVREVAWAVTGGEGILIDYGIRKVGTKRKRYDSAVTAAMNTACKLYGKATYFASSEFMETGQ